MSGNICGELVHALDLSARLELRMTCRARAEKFKLS